MNKAFVEFPEIIALWGDKSCEVKEFLQNGCQFEDSLFPLIYSEQTHSKEILQVDKVQSKITKVDIPDGFITNKANISLLIKAADCVPVLFYAPSQKVIGAVHSGRIGTQKNICGEMVSHFKNYFSINPQDIYVEIGPAISGEHYEVDKVCFDEFVSATKIDQNYPFLDLKKTIKVQLARAGISHIKDLNKCTFSDENYFSYRENKTTERQFTLIRILPKNEN